MESTGQMSGQMAGAGGDGSHRAGFVALVGKPNVGKSTLMNALLQHRLSIVTPRPQTTRQRVLGILTKDDCQILFLDTPGLLEPGYRLQEYMLQSAVHTLHDSDAAVAIVDATRFERDLDDRVAGFLEQSRGPVILAINKIDRIPRISLLPKIERAADRFPFTEIVPVSALKGDGLEPLLSAVIRVLPAGPALYPADMLTDQPERFFVGEIIREHLFLALREELPYASAVIVEDFTDRPNGTAFIQAGIIIERASQKGIIIGKNGRMLKRIGSSARKAIVEFLDRPVYLDLRVKVRPSWRKKEQELRRLGYTRR
ncbi:MAG: GTPase Era [Gemmatimonadetes bacterium]|nr:GTPase Era [Gemmatimonadota bacterium]